MQKLVFTFQNRTIMFDNSDELIAPYFAGYCGSHASVYKGLKQLGGDVRMSEFFGSNSRAFGSIPKVSKHRRDKSDSGVYLFKVLLTEHIIIFSRKHPPPVWPLTRSTSVSHLVQPSPVTHLQQLQLQFATVAMLQRQQLLDGLTSQLTIHLWPKSFCKALPTAMASANGIANGC